MRAHRGYKLSRLRQMLERLEDRAMLSATFGSMHGYGGGGFGPHDAGGRHSAEPAAFAAGPQHSAGYEAQNFRGVHESGYSYGGFHDRPAMYQAFGPRPEMRSFDRGWSHYGMWNQFVASPAVNSPPMRIVSQRPEPSIADNYLSLPVASSKPTPATQPANFVVEPILMRIVSNRPLTASGSPVSISIEPPINVIPSASEVLNFASTLTELTGVPPIVSRDTNSIAALSAAARDLVFQDYTPGLLLATASSSNSYDRANLGALGAERAPIAVLDGFIRPYDESSVDGVVDSTDALTREREAVNAVLGELRDVETPLPASTMDAASPVGESQMGQLSNIQVDLQIDTLSDEVPAGEVEGGMVLLQSTGDANESGFDLTPVYADQIERLVAQPAMETSVGLYQAVDVAVDESPVADIAQPADSTLVPQGESHNDDRLPTELEQTSSHKAAALIGATTLTGALLWMRRTDNEDCQPLPTAQKRHAHC